VDDPVCGDALRASGTSPVFVGVKSLEDWVIRRKPLSCVADFDWFAAKGSSETIRVGTETSKI